MYRHKLRLSLVISYGNSRVNIRDASWKCRIAKTDVDIERERPKRFLHVLLSASGNSIREIHPSRETKSGSNGNSYNSRWQVGGEEAPKRRIWKICFRQRAGDAGAPFSRPREDVLSRAEWKIAIGKSSGDHPDVRDFLRRRRRRHESVIFTTSAFLPWIYELIAIAYLTKLSCLSSFVYHGLSSFCCVNRLLINNSKRKKIFLLFIYDLCRMQ